MATIGLRDITVGLVSIQIGSGGTPDHTATSGSTYLDTQTGLLYTNTDGAASWISTGSRTLDFLSLWGGLPFFNAFAAQSFSAVNFSATNIYVSGTPLSQMFALSGTTAYVQPGLNITTGGTTTAPVINVVGSPIFTAVTAVSISGTSLSATTFFSGSTNIGLIFSQVNHTHVSSAITDATYGGNYSADADRLLKVNSDGGISLSSSATTPAIVASNPDYTALSVLSTEAYGIEATSVNLAAAYFESINDHGIHVTSVNGPGALIVTLDAGNTEDILNLRNNSLLGLNVKNDGGLQWTSPTGSGTTRTNLGLSNVFVSPGVNVYTASTAFNTIIGVVGSPVFTGVTSQTISGTSVSATTFYSGSTNLNYLLGQSSTPATYVQPGNNITTGGTVNAPTINLVASPSVLNLISSGVTFAPSLSGNTIYSGSSELGGLLAAYYAPISVVPTYVQPGINTTTGGTIARPIIHVVGSPSFTAVTASSVSGTSVSATTFYSGNTNLNYLLGQSSTPATYVQPGVNITTGGTVTSPIVHVSGSPSFTAVTAGTYTSGATELSIALSNKFNSAYAPISVQNQWVQPGLNMTTGGTPNAPIINLGGSISLTAVTSPTVTANTALSARGTNDFTDSTNTVTNSTWNSTDASPMTFGGGVLKFDRSILYIGNKSTFSADVSDGTTRFVVGRLGEFESGLKITGNGEVSSNFSATTYYSGNTLLTTSITNLTNSLYAPISVVATYAQNGNQITTGGTITRPTLNLVSSPAVNNLIASGVSYGATVSGATIYEGSTLLSSKYAPKDLSVTLNSGTYILALTDDSRLVDMSGASAQNVVVPRNSSIAFPIGSQVMVAQTGAGQVSFSADTGVTILSYNSQVKLTGLYATASLVKKDTNTWLLGGNLTT